MYDSFCHYDKKLKLFGFRVFQTPQKCTLSKRSDADTGGIKNSAQGRLSIKSPCLQGVSRNQDRLRGKLH